MLNRNFFKQVVGSTYCLVQKSIDGGGCCNDTKINTLLLINQGWEGVIKSSNYSTLLNLITKRPMCVARPGQTIINNFRLKLSFVPSKLRVHLKSYNLLITCFHESLFYVRIYNTFSRKIYCCFFVGLQGVFFCENKQLKFSIWIPIKNFYPFTKKISWNVFIDLGLV